MVDARRTKRARDSSDEMTLEEHITIRRAKLVKERREAPTLRQVATELRADADCMTKRWQRRGQLDARLRASELEKEAEIRESMIREHEYETSVVSYLRMYHQRVDVALPTTASRKSDTIEAYVKHSDLTGQRKSSIIDEYLVDMKQAPAKVAMAARDECPKCVTKLLLHSQKSLMTCPQCGYAMTYLDATSTSTSFDDIIEYSQYSYKRASHFAMWVALCQGKEAHRVPDSILKQVMDELYQQRVRTPDEITQKRVRDILRRLKIRKGYDHVVQITERLSGIPAKRIPPEKEHILRTMFLQMQPAFERHAPKTRTNFLSYSYVLYRCFQIVGLHGMLDGLTLLKGRDKLENNDAIFRKMSEQLGWPTFDLPPIGS